MNTRGIIIEGITGAGKTSTLKAVLSHPDFNSSWAPYDVFREEETFGEFMGELLENPGAPTDQKLRHLRSVIHTASARARKAEKYRFVMERAHYSYYALLRDWTLYEQFDRDLAALNPHVFLLWVPEESLRARSLYRAEIEKWAEGFLNLYGSEAKALETFIKVQQLRYDAIRRSAIPHTVIDTSEMSWDSYAGKIVHALS